MSVPSPPKRHAMPVRRLLIVVAGLAAVAILVACGSTVPTTGNELALPTTGTSGSAADPSLGMPNGAGTGASGGTSGGGSGGGSGGLAQPAAGGGVSTGESTTAGPTTAGASGADPGSDAGAQAPGVTSTTIKVGFPYVDSEDSNDFVDAIGASGIAVGDSRAQFKALVDELNEAGGIFGRNVSPVFHRLNTGQSSETNQQAACEHFTRDERVFAVLAGGGVTLGDGATLRACLARAAIPQVNGRLSVAGDSAFRAATLYVEPSAVGLDTIGRTYPKQLAAAGFLEKAPGETEVRLGVLYFEEPAFAHAYQNHLKPGFAAVGVPVTADYAVPGDNLAALNAAVQNAVLRFRSEGINRVTFMDYDAFTVGFFMVAAEQQGYKPTYAINSQNAPANLAANAQVVSEHQLEGTYMVGWRPLYDTFKDDSLKPAGQAACLNAIRKRDVSMPSRNAQGSVVTYCDGLSFLRAALQRGGRVSAAAFHAGTNALRDGFVPGATYRSFLTADKHDGVSHVRHGRFVDDCTCFRYTSRLLRLR